MASESDSLTLDRGVVAVCRWPSHDPFAAAVNALARSHPGHDLAVVADSWRAPVGWLAALQRAAYADDTIAAASPLATGGGAPPFPGFDGEPVFQPAAATEHVARPSDAVHPRMATLWPHCTYIRRSALDLLGPFEEALRHPTAVLAEFAARAMDRGLSCVLADDVVGASVADGLGPCPPTEIAQVIEAHPWLASGREAQEALELGPLRRALVGARVAGRDPSITVDARALGGPAAGTQNYIHGLTLALGCSGLHVRALVRDNAPDALREELEAAGLGVLTEGQAAQAQERTDIAHRPQQAFVPEDLSVLRRLGERIVLTHLDLIGYRNPSYHSSAQEWWRYRRLTRIALGTSDRVVFLSEHARRDAVSEELVEPAFTAIVGAGITPAAEPPPQRRPEPVPPDRPFVVMIGSDYFHKNRLFALALMDEWRARQGWDGVLVLAGGHVADGGSAGAEAEFLAARPDLAARVIDLGRVEEDEKQWLLSHARALLCPSLYEGFGLTPLEAAAAELPCVYAPVTSLAEIIQPEAATISPWNAKASAERSFPLLRESQERERHLAMLTAALERHQWGSIVDQLRRVYDEAIHSPYRPAAARPWEELGREELIVELDRARIETERELTDFRDRVEYGMALVDRGGLLTRDQQRGLMRIASRRWLGAPLLAPLGLLGSLGSRRNRPRKV